MWVFIEPCRASFYVFLQQLLSGEHPIGEVNGSRVSVEEKDAVMLWRGRLPKQIAVECCIYLPMQKNRLHPIGGDVRVVCADDRRNVPEEKGCYLCGFSQKACLTISSKTEEQLVISLAKEITSVYGRRIEPFDLPVKRVKNLSDSELLYAYMTKLLLYPVKQ